MGRAGDSREYYAASCPDIRTACASSGRIPIDARQPLDQVADAILSSAMAGSATSHASSQAITPAIPPHPGDRQASPEDDPGDIGSGRASL